MENHHGNNFNSNYCRQTAREVPSDSQSHEQVLLTLRGKTRSGGSQAEAGRDSVPVLQGSDTTQGEEKKSWCLQGRDLELSILASQLK